MNRMLGLGAAALAISWLAGCKKENVVEYEPNMVYAHAREIDSGYPMEKALAETQTALDLYFGTPDAPKLPEFLLEEDEEYATLISEEHLMAASGDPSVEGRGLYRQHCATCHGIVGNGRGTTAALLDPYPRDYRTGTFKYKSTRRGAKPLDSDLAYVIKHGIDGTSMKVIPELTDEDIEALVDYVKYLSIRGQFEREMVMEGEFVDFESPKDGGDSEHLFDQNSEGFEDQQDTAQDFVFDIADSWLEAEDQVTEVPEPVGIPVPETIEELLAELEKPGDTPLKQSVAIGKELFASEKAACAKCHGKEGYGDGQTQDYDDWTKEWTVRIGVDPTDEAAQVPLIARGALPPRIILPRDFREGLYRGGSEPDKLYLRIVNGIEGSPMPAAAVTDEETSDFAVPRNEIWHLINYVRSLANPENLKDMKSASEASEPSVAQL